MAGGRRCSMSKTWAVPCGRNIPDQNLHLGPNNLYANSSQVQFFFLFPKNSGKSIVRLSRLGQFRADICQIDVDNTLSAATSLLNISRQCRRCHRCRQHLVAATDLGGTFFDICRTATKKIINSNSKASIKVSKTLTKQSSF